MVFGRPLESVRERVAREVGDARSLPASLALGLRSR